MIGAHTLKRKPQAQEHYSEFPLSAFSSDQDFVEMQTSTKLLIGHNEHIPDDSHPLSECTASAEWRRLDVHFKSILQCCVYTQSQSSYVLLKILIAFNVFNAAVSLNQLLTVV